MGAETLGKYMHVQAFRAAVDAQHGSQEGHAAVGPGRPRPTCLLLLCSTIGLCTLCTVHGLRVPTLTPASPLVAVGSLTHS